MASAPFSAAWAIILLVAISRAFPIISVYSVNSPPTINLTMADRSFPSQMANTVWPWTRPRISEISRPGNVAEFNSKTEGSATGVGVPTSDILFLFCSSATVNRTRRIPPKRQKTAALSHQGTTGSSATITCQGIPTNTAENSPSTKASEPMCRSIFISSPLKGFRQH